MRPPATAAQHQTAFAVRRQKQALRRGELGRVNRRLVRPAVAEDVLLLDALEQGLRHGIVERKWLEPHQRAPRNASQPGSGYGAPSTSTPSPSRTWPITVQAAGTDAADGNVATSG